MYIFVIQYFKMKQTFDWKMSSVFSFWIFMGFFPSLVSSFYFLPKYSQGKNGRREKKPFLHFCFLRVFNGKIWKWKMVYMALLLYLHEIWESRSRGRMEENREKHEIKLPKPKTRCHFCPFFQLAFFLEKYLYSDKLYISKPLNKHAISNGVVRLEWCYSHNGPECETIKGFGVFLCYHLEACFRHTFYLSSDLRCGSLSNISPIWTIKSVPNTEQNRTKTLPLVLYKCWLFWL